MQSNDKHIFYGKLALEFIYLVEDKRILHKPEQQYLFMTSTILKIICEDLLSSVQTTQISRVLKEVDTIYINRVLN